jgi:hypothetical protein
MRVTIPVPIARGAGRSGNSGVGADHSIDHSPTTPLDALWESL